MKIPGVVTGVVGTIKWHYYPAAAINNWAVTRLSKDRRLWQLHAIVVLANAYNMAQSPLTFTAKYRGGEWTWPIVPNSLTREERNGIPQVIAQLGAPTSRKGGS